MLTDHDRIRRQKERPAFLRLWQALQRLRTVVTFLQTGAHPDDETTSMLAALRLRDGVRTVFACSTRGEGGQNGIGPEKGTDIGVLRTREMEAAAVDIDLSVRWLSSGPDDPMTDFGFSKGAEETLGKWGAEHTVEELVRVIRTERPDMVAPTFLDVSGQHGHHRAMTRSTRRAIELAADPAAFPDQIRAGLKPWQAAKWYLPAWSGAGQSYDDDFPPPNATVSVDVGGRDPVTGATYLQIAEWSRAGHATQGMGRYADPRPGERPLHLEWTANGEAGSEESLLDGLPKTLADLAGPGDPAAFADALAATDAALAATLRAWPDAGAVGRAAAGALTTLRGALALCPATRRDAVGHRLERKAAELSRVLFEASGLAVRAVATPAIAAAGATVTVAVSVFDGGGLADAAPAVSLVVPDGWTVEGDGTRFTVGIPADARPDDGYPRGFEPAGGNGPVHARVRFRIDGVEAVHAVDLEERIAVVPPVSVTATPDAFLGNLAGAVDGFATKLLVTSFADQPVTADIAPRLPAGWRAEPAALTAALPARGSAVLDLRLVPDGRPAEGRVTVGFAVNGTDAGSVRIMGYPHTGTVVRTAPAAVRIGLVDAALPEGVTVGYVGGGIDRVGEWLERLGIRVVALDAADLASGDLSRFATIVVGVFAVRTRPDLAAALPRLHDWVRAGGHLVTLYHKPWDNWDPATVPPAYLKIGQPSLRWRVTDENAAVTVLVPGHPLLNRPNKIGPDDWAGWRKERGLYFAAEWDPAYEPLLAMSDPGETPLKGSLLSAPIGRGRHTHTSLILHHQMDELVPGAFRLMANLVAPA